MKKKHLFNQLITLSIYFCSSELDLSREEKQKLNDSLQKRILELEEKLEIATKTNKSLSKSANAENKKASTELYENIIIRKLT